MSLKETLANYRRDLEAGKSDFPVTRDIIELMHRGTADLVASGQADRTLTVGDKAPSFVLAASDGASVSSDEMLKDGPLAVSFYRGVWCPYCNFDLQALQNILPELDARNTRLVAISPQTQANSRRSERENGLTFPILNDIGNAVAHQFGLAFRLPDYLIEGVYKALGADLSVFNGDDSWELPMPGRFLIGQDGIIQYAEVDPDYTTRPEPTVLIEAIDQHLGGRHEKLAS